MIIYWVFIFTLIASVLADKYLYPFFNEMIDYSIEKIKTWGNDEGTQESKRNKEETKNRDKKAFDKLDAKRTNLEA